MKNDLTSLPVIVIGCGGHSKVLLDTLKALNIQILGAVDADPSKNGSKILGISVMGSDDWLLKHPPTNVRLVNGLGGVSSTRIRKEIFEKFKKRGYSFLTLIHPSAWVGSEVVLGEGAQIMAGARVQPGCQIGLNSLINTGATVDHDCELGDHIHIAPGATLCGYVKIGSSSVIGSGSTLIQQIQLGPETLIGAGSLVIDSFEMGRIKAFGSPAREVK
jgi:sugar O-acyltransferase (sialic acid O-acetyltransferase NeuD family)